MARPLEHFSDEALARQSEAGQDPGQATALIETLFRTRDALNAEMRAANELSGKIHGLNWALFWYTVALGLMAAFQFGAWLRDFTR